MFDLIGNVLAWFYSLVPNYAIAIVLLTLLIMVLFTPLTLKGTRSMMQMQELQPEIKRIQSKYKDDRQTLNEEMMKLYQSKGVNPLGGCLPSLVQLPVFFVLYRVINGLTKTDDEGNPTPENLDADTDMYMDLIADGGEMVAFGIDLSRSANSVLQDNFIDALPYLGLVAFTFFLSWYQQRQMKSRRTDSVAANPQMEMMMKILPFMLPVFAFIVQAALAVYFIASSAYRIGQQAFIHATLKKEPADASDAVIDVEVEEESEPEEERPRREVANKRSKKAIAAAEERQAARAARSAQRRGGNGTSRPSRDANRNGKNAKNSPSDNGRAPIQSKRTAGDGRTRKRKK